MTRGDKVLIVIVVILTFVSLGFIKKQTFSTDDKFASIQVDGREIKKIIFDSNIVGKEIPIKTEYGYNLIEVGDGKIRVVEASCPDKIDVKQGYISKIGETIVCLPNKMLIEIKGIDGRDGIDIMNH